MYSDISSAALLDDRQEWLRFSQPRDGLWDSHVVIQGMHCAACAFTVEDALLSVPGVRSVEVNAATHRAKVVWSEEQVKPSQWVAAIARAGYGALPAADNTLRQARQEETRRALWRWLVAGFCMMQVMMYAYPAYVAGEGDITPDMVYLLRWASWVLTLPVVFFSCGPFFGNALRDIRLRRISMDLPVALGMAITFMLSSAATFEPSGMFGGEVYYDSLTMFVFFLLTGRWLELRVRDRTAGALEALMNRLPDSVERQHSDGSFERVAVRRLLPGDVIRVLPAESFPADGVILEGQTLADEALLTGESRPQSRAMGDRVVAGSHNLVSAVLVRVEQVGEGTQFSQIVSLMENASLQKPRLAQLADRVAKPFLLGVLVMAALAAAWWWPSNPSHALMVAVAVLVVTCPCALSLATPAAMLAAAGNLARHGVLVRQLQALESLAEIDLDAMFDYSISLDPDDFWVAVAGTDLTTAIREQKVAEFVSNVARIQPVRDFMKRLTHRLVAESGKAGVVVEGRDITTVVAPEAKIRLLLTASEEVRLKRRSAELDPEAAKEVHRQVSQRDQSDSKVVDFMTPAPGVVLVDTTELNFVQTVAAVRELIERGLNAI